MPETRSAWATWLFLRLLALSNAVAFASFGVQAQGLIGSDGIMPAEAMLPVVGKLGRSVWWTAPSVYWRWPSDATITAIWVAGVVVSALLFAGVAPAPCCFVLWALYLSIQTIGGEFMSFQWDTLLTEATFAAMLVAPWRPRPAVVEPSRFGVWTLRWLVFRLMFFAGWVKLSSGDETWRDLTALDYHYWTQPLPNPLAWYAAHLPEVVQKASVAGTFVIELVLPFFVFGPRVLRAIAFLGFVALMGLLELTGNFGFFQLLTVALAAILLDDEDVLRAVPAGLLARLAVRERAGVRDPVGAVRQRFGAVLDGWAAWWPVVGKPAFAERFAAPVAILLIGVSIPWVLLQLSPSLVPSAGRAVLKATMPFRTVNHYGLFAVMTTERPTVVFEGSDDGVDWREYALPYQVGPLDRAPPVVAPHMPRLDWQLWFAGLGDCRHDAWVLDVEQHLADGTADVVRLFGTVPFDHPPKYVRTTLYRYELADDRPLPAGWEQGTWWRRKRIGEFCPAVER